MASIRWRKRRDGSRYPEVRWRDPDGAQRSKSFAGIHNARDAEREATIFRAEVTLCEARGERYTVRPDAAPGIAKVMVTYLSAVARSKAPDTLNGYRDTLEHFRRWFVGWCAPGRATPGRLSIAALEGYWTFCRRTQSSNTARTNVRRVEKFWNWSATRTDEWDGVLPAPKSIDLPRVTREMRPAPTWAQLDATIGLLDGWHCRFYTLLRYTFMRGRAARSAAWAWLDPSHSRLTVPAEFSKNGNPYVIPVHPALAEAWSTWGARDGYIVPDMPPGARTRDVRRELFNRAWRESGAPSEVYKRRPLHCVRHCFRTWGEAEGLPELALEYLMGHDLGIRGRYIDPAQGLDLRAVIERVPAIGASSTGVVTLLREA